MDLEKKPEPEQQPQPQRQVSPAETAPAETVFADPQGSLRASDADRDRIADILRDALAEGRIDAEEHSDRIDAVYRAKTVGELEPIVRDLPGARRHQEPAPEYGYAPDGADGPRRTSSRSSPATPARGAGG